MLIWGAVLFLLLTAAFLFSGLRMKALERENRLLHSYMETAQEFYEEIQKRMEVSQKYRHDLAKHIQTLESLLEKREEGQEVRTYMEGLKKEYAELKRRSYCQDEIVETVLSMKAQQCREQGIPIEIHVEDCLYGEMEEADMAGLLCNLLDNAIEANQRCRGNERKGIWFYMEKKENKILITIKNCLPLKEEFSFATKKPGKGEHGIGTKIIKGLVDKYQGTRETEADRNQGMVTDRILLFGKEIIWN